MTVSTEIRLGIGAFLVLLLAVAFAGIALFDRMSPAIEQIIAENVYSMESAEEMLSVLAAHPGAVPVEARRRYNAALRRAQGNITHKDEHAWVVKLGRLSPAALDGAPQARRPVVEALRGLARANRHAMVRADHRAQRVGTAGAWAMVILGLLGVLLAVAVFRRLLRRLLHPLGELDETLRAAVRGDRHRRTHVEEAPDDLRRLAADLNSLLDQRPTVMDPEPDERG